MKKNILTTICSLLLIPACWAVSDKKDTMETKTTDSGLKYQIKLYMYVREESMTRCIMVATIYTQRKKQHRLRLIRRMGNNGSRDN